MKKVLAFGASNSRNSINKKFAAFAVMGLANVESFIADLNDFQPPLYSIDLQNEMGIDENALRFYDLINQSDAFVVSLAEYNGLHTTAFKNLWDWLSRIPLDKPMQIWGGKPMFLLSTSPGKRPMSNVLKVSKELFPHFGANIIADFHLPSFHHSFIDNTIIDVEQLATFEIQKNKFQTYLNQH